MALECCGTPAAARLRMLLSDTQQDAAKAVSERRILKDSLTTEPKSVSVMCSMQEPVVGETALPEGALLMNKATNPRATSALEFAMVALRDAG